MKSATSTKWHGYVVLVTALCTGWPPTKNLRNNGTPLIRYAREKTFRSGLSGFDVFGGRRHEPRRPSSDAL